MTLTLACLVFLVLSPSFGAAQQGGVVGGPPAPQAPPRDAAKANSGTSVIRGHVVAADTGQPLRKATVRIFGPEIRENRIATTDADGAYEFANLPAGRYQLNASKGSFVSLAYGQTRPLQGGTPLEIRENQAIEKVDFALPRGAVITGRVLDEFGEPVADTRVAIMRYQFTQGGRRLVPSGRSAMTNDIGEYRLFGLSPGQYYLSATLTNAMGFAAGGADSSDREGYAPTYYPAATSAADAQRLAVGLGQTLTDINVSLVPVRTARVSGVAYDAQGRPMTRGNVMIAQRFGMAFMGTGGGPLRPDGTFTLSGIAPGEYTIRAIVPPLAPGGTPDVATASVAVAGDDVTGVRLIVVPPVTVSGRIVADPAAAGSLNAASLRVSLVPASADDGPFTGMMGPAVVQDDFTFATQVRPGRFFVRANVMGAGWTLRAVRLNGADVTDSGIEVKAGENLDDVDVELTNRLSEISGAVGDVNGASVRDYTVVVFARDAQRWGFMSRWVGTGRPDQDGRFKVRGLPAGDYLIAALPSVEPGESNDPEFLEKLRDLATPLSVGDGETKTVDLKLASQP